MKKNISIREILKYLADLIIKYNLVLFIVITSIGLIVVILTVNNIFQLPYNPKTSSNNSGSSQNIQLDQTTLTQLEQMETSDNNTHGQDIPTGRINPFSE